MKMRSIAELETIIGAVSLEAAESIYNTLDSYGEQKDLSIDEAYQQILEAIVYDVLKTPKK